MVATKPQRDTKLPSTLELALDYVDCHRGRHIFPIKAGAKSPPLIADNLNKASNDPTQIEAWHVKWPGCNWGVALKKSGVIVVDVDCKDGKRGLETYRELDRQYGWPPTEKVETPSGGWHLYYDGKHVFALGERGFGPSIDAPIYTLIPGCTLAGGKSYRYVPGAPKVKPAPSWFYEVLGRPTERSDQSQDPAVDWDKPENVEWASNFLQYDAPLSRQGSNGDATILHVAGVLKDRGISEEMALDLMVEHYNDRCEPPWLVGEGADADRLEIKVRNAYRYLRETQPGADTPEAEFGSDPLPPPTDEERKAEEKAREKEQQRRKREGNSGLLIVCADEVVPKNIDFVWPRRLARGKHTCFAGVGGLGKSQLLYATAATITRGGAWPENEGNAPRGTVVLLSAEDGIEDVMVPRLIAAGADRSRIRIVKAVRAEGGPKKFNILNDLDRLAAACRELGDVVLVGFDPVSSYLGGDIDSHRDTELRNALDPISQMAEACNVAVMSVTHFNKATSTVNAMNRVMGGAGFVNAPRAAFAIMEDPENGEGRLLLHLKNNLSPPAQGLRFHVEQVDAGVDERDNSPITSSRIVWDGSTDITADAVAATGREHDTPRLDEAIRFLETELRNGPAPARDVQGHAKELGISVATLRRARQAIGIISSQIEGVPHGGWQYEPPVTGSTSDPFTN